MTTVAEKVAAFLRERKPNSYCDECIRNAFSLKRHQQAQQVTSAGAAAGGFVREDGICAGCQKDRTVTRSS
jgi:hypothetical protein